MNRFHSVLAGLLAGTLGLAAVAGADQPATEWTAQVRPGFLSADSDGVAGYTDILVPLWQDRQMLLFVNPRAVFTDTGPHEQNVGLGVRRLTHNDEVILGANLFYDTRWSEGENRFHQAGLGLEALSRWLDLRLNYYHPFSKAVREPAFDTFGFGGSTLLRFPGFEEPLRGLDYEAGLLVPWVSDILETRAYVGRFAFESRKAKDVQGWQVRVESRPTPWITLEWELEHAAGRGSDSFLGGYVTLPFEFGNLLQGKNPFSGWRDALRVGQGTRPLRARMTDRVVRDLAVVSQTQASTTPEETPVLSDLIFVDNRNDADPAEDGTSAHPHNTLAEALANPRYGPGTTIRIERGDGTAVGQTGSFTLTNNVTVWGSGFDAGFPGVPVTSPPIIDGGGGNMDEDAAVFTIARDATIQGLEVRNADFGIFGVAASLGTVTIRDNTLSTYTNDAILLVGSDPVLTVNVERNTISASNATGINVSYGGTGQGVLTVRDNVVTGTGTNTGISLSHGGTSGMVTGTVTGNTVTDSGADGISALINPGFAGTAASGNWTITGNTLQNNATTGISVSHTGDEAGTTATIANNIVTGNATTGGIVLNMGGDVCFGACPDNMTLTATISGNRVTGNTTSPGIHIRGRGGVGPGSSITAALSGNTSTGNTVGISLVNSDQVDNTFTIDAGGGVLGSAGQNRLFSNTTSDILNDSGANNLKAEQNWFGADLTATLSGANTVDTTPVLTADPSP